VTYTFLGIPRLRPHFFSLFSAHTHSPSSLARTATSIRHRLEPASPPWDLAATSTVANAATRHDTTRNSIAIVATMEPFGIHTSSGILTLVISLIKLSNLAFHLVIIVKHELYLINQISIKQGPMIQHFNTPHIYLHLET
jgi:hypothetical protein